jgi:hypothetical protein
MAEQLAFAEIYGIVGSKAVFDSIPNLKLPPRVGESVSWDAFHSIDSRGKNIFSPRKWMDVRGILHVYIPEKPAEGSFQLAYQEWVFAEASDGAKRWTRKEDHYTPPSDVLWTLTASQHQLDVDRFRK